MSLNTILSSLVPAVVEAQVHAVLLRMGVPRRLLPDPDQIALTVLVTLFTLSLSWLLIGRRQRRKHRDLMRELELARQRVEELETIMEDIEQEEAQKRSLEKREIRVWMDGAFDLFHYGHMNAFRQGRSLGTYLVVGVNDDESITKCKGSAPVLNDDERIGAVSGCRWVDEIVPHCPYVMSAEYLNMVIEKYKIDYVVHGDDPCIVDGKDVYQDAKDRGLYRSIPRTTGVSTTDIVGRMLVMSRDHHDRLRHSPVMGSLISKEKEKEKSSRRKAASSVDLLTDGTVTARKSPSPEPSPSPKLVPYSAVTEEDRPLTLESHFVRRSKFLTTGRMIRIFSQECKEPKDTDRVVYMDGAWDMFHVGHVEALKAARELGDFLIVGVHNDDLINAHRGSNFPIMNLNERVLSVLGCRYVDDVLIDAPWDISREMIAALKISIVATGTTRDCDNSNQSSARYYEVPRSLGMLRELKSKQEITVEEIVGRILSQESVYQAKLKKKTKAENEYYTERFGFDVTKPDIASSAPPNEEIPKLQL